MRRGYLLFALVFILVACAFPVIEKQYTPGTATNWQACLAQCEVKKIGVQIQRNQCNYAKRTEYRLSSLKAKYACDSKDTMCIALANSYYPSLTTEYDECNDKFDTEETYDACYRQCGGGIKEVCTANCDKR